MLSAVILNIWSRAHQHVFLLILSSHFHFALPHSCYSLFLFSSSLTSSPSREHNRRTQCCRLCRLCSRCTAFLTSMGASWWDPSLHCTATRSWWPGSSLTAVESPQTGERTWKMKRDEKKEGLKAGFYCTICQMSSVSVNIVTFPIPCLILFLPLPVLYQRWRDFL